MAVLVSAIADTETPTVQPQSESRISVADVVGQRMPTLTPHTLSPLQRKLTVGQPGDKYEQEADTVAAKVVEQINSPTSQQPVQGKVEPVAQPTVMRDGGVGGGAVDASVEQSIQQAKGSGQGLSEDVRELMEQAFGADFSGVRVHNNSNADQLNRSLNARAFTTGPDIFFKQGEYNPGSRNGQELLAHELTHVVQQGVGQKQTLQRTLGDGHDLTSPRFSKLLDLEEAYDNETLIKKGSSGRGVQAIQQALYDIGIPLPKFGADGEFGAETDAAVRQFQKGKGLVPDGLVGPKTMAALDARFPPVTLPAKAKLRATWNWSCVKDILCPWSPHTVDVLSSYTVKSFDSIFWDDEKWDGKSWVVDPFPGGGYQSTSDREIGLLNDETCEAVAETLYHEVLHAKQPSTHSTTQEVEGYAYRIGEEFSIGMGLSGFPELRSSDAQGREYADQAKVDEFVAAEYPSVAGGGEEIIGQQSIQQAKGSGQGLSEDVREPMEQAFGADFSGVRLHNNSNADQLNRSLNARAFTTGPDIFFKQGEYNPGSRDGQELLAHELTHVVQQTTASKPIARMKTEVIQRVAVAAPAVVFGPVGLTIVGFGIVVWYLNNGGWEEIGRISNVIARGIDGTLEDLENILNRAGDTAREGLREIEDYIREHIFPMAARGNQADTGILAEANELISSGRAGDICEALAILMAEAKAAGDTNKINRIKATQKAKRCRHSRHSRDS